MVCIELPSTLYWSSGEGLFKLPSLLEGGTLNCTTVVPLVQWPAVRKQLRQSSISQPVHPIGRMRAERGSVEGTRSSTGPHCDSYCAQGRPAEIEARRTRLGPVRGCATTSTCTASPLK